MRAESAPACYVKARSIPWTQRVAVHFTIVILEARNRELTTAWCCRGAPRAAAERQQQIPLPGILYALALKFIYLKATPWHNGLNFSSHCTATAFRQQHYRKLNGSELLRVCVAMDAARRSFSNNSRACVCLMRGEKSFECFFFLRAAWCRWLSVCTRGYFQLR